MKFLSTFKKPIREREIKSIYFLCLKLFTLSFPLIYSRQWFDHFGILLLRLVVSQILCQRYTERNLWSIRGHAHAQKTLTIVILSHNRPWTFVPLNWKYCFVGNTPRVIMGSQQPLNPISKVGGGFTWWSIQFDRVVGIYIFT